MTSINVLYRSVHKEIPLRHYASIGDFDTEPRKGQTKPFCGADEIANATRRDDRGDGENNDRRDQNSLLGRSLHNHSAVERSAVNIAALRGVVFRRIVRRRLYLPQSSFLAVVVIQAEQEQTPG